MGSEINRVTNVGSESGATTVEYAVALLGIAGAVLLIAGFLEFSIASRVNDGRDCYTTVDLQDPSVTGSKCR